MTLRGALVMGTGEFFNKTRVEYSKGELDERTVDTDPLKQFTCWFEAAAQGCEPEPNACALATTGSDMQPSARMVLVKSFDESGFVFFTNYLSAKGTQLDQNKKAALLFYWPSLERQIRIEGSVEKTSEVDSDRYFQSRPRNSRLGSSASLQSQVAASREEIEGAMSSLATSVGDGEVIRPPHWGGYRLQPALFEFWQGRENRLHDRIVYRKDGSSWIRERLWP
jgi:pyridoxamine 5'-phosphate oxidase